MITPDREEALRLFGKWWNEQREANKPGLLGADFRHWAWMGWNAAIASAQPQGESDKLRANLLDKTLREHAHRLRREACSAWSAVIGKGDIDQAKCEYAQAIENRLRCAIDELAEASPPAQPHACPHLKTSDDGTSYCELAQAQPQQEPVAWTDERELANLDEVGRCIMWRTKPTKAPPAVALYASSPAATAPEGFVLAESAAKVCDQIAELREQGAGLIDGPGSRLRQAARMIRELAAGGKHE